jgi:hypothetical protein
MATESDKPDILVYHCPPTRSVRIVFLLEELGIPCKVRKAAMHACCFLTLFPVCKEYKRRTSPPTGANSKMLTAVVPILFENMGGGMELHCFSDVIALHF